MGLPLRLVLKLLAEVGWEYRFEAGGVRKRDAARR
jgi:hypothetical protein